MKSTVQFSINKTYKIKTIHVKIKMQKRENFQFDPRSIVNTVEK